MFYLLGSIYYIDDFAQGRAVSSIGPSKLYGWPPDVLTIIAIVARTNQRDAEGPLKLGLGMPWTH